MSQIDIDRTIKIKLFEFAPAEAIPPIIKEQFESGEIINVVNMLDCILEANLSGDQISAAISAIEDEFLLKDLPILRQYLLLLNDKAGNEDMARYYLDLCIEEIRENSRYERILSKYALAETECLDGEYHQYDFARNYFIDGEEKGYQVYSFSNEIGKNMTLLKTPYGSIIFDCGAKCNKNDAQIISEIELKSFLLATETSIKDIKAVIISHAHVDHYGSLATIINVGINPKAIFMSEGTKALIVSSSRNMMSLDDVRTIDSFFVANKKIVINSFVNGHILGSECYLVSFDNINVLYTGDYCLHDQQTVKGLNPQSILNMLSVKENGVDCIISESTYGNSQHYLKFDCATRALKHLVNKLLTLGIKVFLPSFAIGRSQEIALMLNKEHSVLLDGLAVRISREYENLTDLKIFNSNTRFSIADEDENKTRNFDCNNVIIASSGMLSKDSTSYNYVRDFLANGKNIAVIKTGFISSESYGNDILNEWSSKDNILLSISLSAHAGYDEIVSLIKALNPRNIVAIHGNGIAHKDQSSSIGDVKPYDDFLEPDSLVDTIEEEDIFFDFDKSDSHDAIDDSFEMEMDILDPKNDIDEPQTIYIEEPQIRNKITNVYKTAKSLKKGMIGLQRAQSFISSCKLLIRFLKTKKEYLELAEYLSSKNDYEQLWEYIKEGFENGFNFIVKWDTENNPANVMSVVSQKDDTSKPEGITEDRILSIPIEELGLSERSYNGLKRANILTVKDLVGKTRNEMFKILNLGATQQVEIEEKLIKLGVGYRKEEIINDSLTFANGNNLSEPPSSDDDFEEKHDDRKTFELEKPFVPRTRFQSDIMIVCVNDNDFYVSEKIRGRDVYYKLLKDRSSKSTHYPTLDMARRIAEEKRQFILQHSPDCQIVELNAEDYPPNAKMATYVEEYFYDNHGNVLFGYDMNRNIVVSYRPEDRAYRYIDICKYSNMILSLKNDNIIADLNFYNLGLMRGFDIALECSLPYIYIEIYKAEELIKSFDYDVELHQFDIEYYEGYTAALTQSVEVQKKCKNEIHYFNVVVADFRSVPDTFTYNKEGEIGAVCNFDLTVCYSKAEFLQQINGTSLYLLFLDKDTDITQIKNELQLNDVDPNRYCMEFKSVTKGSGTRLLGRITALIKQQCELGNGSGELKIDPKWIESFAGFNGISEMVKKNDNKQDSSIEGSDSAFGKSPIPINLTMHYLRTISAIFSDYSVLVDCDFSILKGMFNRCIRKDQADWQTTYAYIGEPDLDTLRNIVADTVLIRNHLREGNYDDIEWFRDKYKRILLRAKKNFQNDCY